MPAGKRRQSNAMLYTLITFVGLFVVATTAAVVYYVKAEDLRSTTKNLQDEMNRMASNEEVRNIGAIVGTRLPGQSNLGTVISNLDQMVELVKGGPVRVTSPEVKLTETKQALQPLLQRARTYVTLPGVAQAAVDPNAAKKADPNKPADPNAAAAPKVVLATLISDLLRNLDKTTQERNVANQELATKKQEYEDKIRVMNDATQKLTQDVKVFADQVGQIKADYDKRRAEVEQSRQEQISTIRSDLEKKSVEAKQLTDNLLKTQAQLNVAEGRMTAALQQFNEIQPAPDKEAPAFKVDGHVALVDEAAGVIQIDLGSDDHIYQGLTFSVYDRAGGIPRDGKPKAQVEVFAIDPKAATARVLTWDRRNPIATGDLIANLIWDRDRPNQFIVVGEFDLNGDGKPDYDGVTKIEALIQRWGGTVAKEVTARTDYLILGTEPKVPTQPTPEAQTADPTALEKYNAAKQKNDQYNQILQAAKMFGIPVFSYNRFLYFTGYAAQANKPGAL